MYEELVQPGPVASADDDAYFDSAEFDQRVHIEDRHFWHLHRREVIRTELERWLAGTEGPGRGARLIELGCGIGTVATHLNAHGLSVDYGDVHGRGLEHAEARARARLGDAASARRWYRADVTRPLPRLDYDGALLLDVIEHLPDDVAALGHVHAALAGSQRAFVLVTVPAFQLLWSPWDDREKHKRRYTESTLRRALETAGFEVARSTYFFAPLFFAALGVKGLRWVRDRVAPTGAPVALADMAEARDLGVADRVVRGVLALERPLLAAGLPLGTSILAIARRRG